MHRGFGEGSSSVVVGAFPVRVAQKANFSDGTVSLEGSGFTVKNRADPTWCNQPKSAPARPSIIAAQVICAVADDFLGGCKVGGSQEGIEGLCVVDLAIGPSDLKAGGIDHNAAVTLRPVRHGQVPAQAA